MEIEEKYRLVYDNMDQIIARHVREEKYPAMGFTSNLDVLCDFNIERFNALIAQYLTGEDLLSMIPAVTIHTIEEFLRTVVYFCRKGIGGEVDIEDVHLLNGLFETKLGMGGTATQAALALSAIEAPSIVHLTDDSKEVCDLLNTPFIHTVDEIGELVHTGHLKQRNEQEVHYIIQFKKGDCIQLNDQSVEIPLSNRLIITQFTVNKVLPFSEAYFRYIEDNAKKISSNVLSSFNALDDEALLRERLADVRKHITQYKAGNREGIVFFEDAHYHNREIRKLCLEMIYPQVDIVSLNEEELAYTLKMDGIELDQDDILQCIEGVKEIRRRYGVQKGIIVHTKDYSMYVGESLSVDIESGLIYGNLLATAKAMHGWYGNKKQIAAVMELPLSGRGKTNQAIVDALEQKMEIKLVPTKYIDKPRYTIGLGDSFVAGVQICFS